MRVYLCKYNTYNAIQPYRCGSVDKGPLHYGEVYFNFTPTSSLCTCHSRRGPEQARLQLTFVPLDSTQRGRSLAILPLVPAYIASQRGCLKITTCEHVSPPRPHSHGYSPFPKSRCPLPLCQVGAAGSATLAFLTRRPRCQRTRTAGTRLGLATGTLPWVQC